MPTDTLRWMDDGSTFFVETVEGLAPHGWGEPSGLPGWTRGHLVAHVAANADALANLVTWAATGEPTPMYPSANARAEGIALGGRLAPAELLAWLRRSTDHLGTAVAGLDEEQWGRPVVTAQGRTVPASEIPWLRAREVWVHAVDLSAGRSFTDLPEGFLVALQADITARRGRTAAVAGPLAQIVAYLAGRPHTAVTAVAGGPAPELGPWL